MGVPDNESGHRADPQVPLGDGRPDESLPVKGVLTHCRVPDIRVPSEGRDNPSMPTPRNATMLLLIRVYGP